MRKISALLIAILIAFSISACNKKEADNTPDTSSQTAVTEGFKAPDSFAAVIKIKINPEFNLYIDKDGNALALEDVNSDAQSILNKIDCADKSLEDTVKSIISAANEGGFIKNNTDIYFEVTQIKDNSLNTADILNRASAAVNSKAAELNIKINVGVPTENNTSTNSNTTNNKPTENSKPTETSKPEESSKPSSSEPPKTEEPAFLNPKTNLPYDKEYAGHFRTEGDNLIASGVAFYKEGGMDGGAYCLLLSPQFEPTKTEDGQMEKEHNGKTYYSAGSGMMPYNMELTDSEILVKNSFSDQIETINLKLTLKPNGTFVVSYSQLAEFPVGTVLSYLRG